MGYLKEELKVEKGLNVGDLRKKCGEDSKVRG